MLLSGCHQYVECNAGPRHQDGLQEATALNLVRDPAVVAPQRTLQLGDSRQFSCRPSLQCGPAIRSAAS